jgi:hypothetical protein
VERLRLDATAATVGITRRTRADALATGHRWIERVIAGAARTRQTGGRSVGVAADGVRTSGAPGVVRARYPGGAPPVGQDRNQEEPMSSGWSQLCQPILHAGRRQSTNVPPYAAG